MAIGIDIKNIDKAYPGNHEKVLKDITFSINPGEKFGILGPNGAGKTTLISIICKIMEANSGAIGYTRNDKPMKYIEFKKVMGYTPQGLAFYEELTPMQNLIFFGAMYGIPKHEVKLKSTKILHALGLTNVKDKKTKKFSGGMKRRFNLAVSLLHEPGILFLDEPTVGVDVQSKNAIMNLIDQLNASGCTIVYTSHYLEEAEVLCDRILLIDKGNTVAMGSTAELKNDYSVTTLEQLFLKTTGTEYRDNV